MQGRELKLGSRLLIGGIAGLVGTIAMTAAMRRLHQRLPEAESYPLPPREIVDSAASATEMNLSEEAARDVTTAAHFAFGAACGSLLAAINPRARLPQVPLPCGLAATLAGFRLPASSSPLPIIRHAETHL